MKKTAHILCILALCSVSIKMVAQNDTLFRGQALHAYDFLNSIGACVHIQHGQDAERIAPLLKYVGIKNIRDAADRNYDMSGLILLNRLTDVKIVIGPGSGVVDDDLEATIKMARKLHKHGALLAVEGPNEPNNFGGLTYRNRKGGGGMSWLPVAEFQRDLYKLVKEDRDLYTYPVYGISETGAQTDNCGLQFLEIPDNAGTLMEAGTKYADFANCHNYMYHPGWPDAPHPNQVWNAADPSSACKVDGLFGNYGKTWLKGFKGYNETELQELPRVSTETGVRVGDYNGKITEHVQGCNYMNLFLSQFKRGWDKTFIYEFLDDPDGSFGFYESDYSTRRLSAVYMHNFTTLLDDKGQCNLPKSLAYNFIDSLPVDVHDLLLQKNNGELWLIIWGECLDTVRKILLKLPAEAEAVTIYDPTVGTDAVGNHMRKRKNEFTIPLEICDHPILLKIDEK